MAINSFQYGADHEKFPSSICVIDRLYTAEKQWASPNNRSQTPVKAHTMQHIKTHRRGVSLALLLIPLHGGLVHAQPVPSAGQILREQPAAPPQPLPGLRQIVPAAPDAPALPADATLITVQRFEFEGATVLPVAQLNALVADVQGTAQRFDAMAAAVQRITAAYRARGYFLARAFIPRQALEGGVLKVQVFEGVLGQLETSALGQSIATQQGLALGQPVQQEALERTILLLAERGFPDATAGLAPGRELGTTALSLRSSQARAPWAASLGLDNGGGTYTGSTRVLGDVTRFGLAGDSDDLSARTSLSTGTRYLALAYGVPVGLDGWRIGLNASGLTYKLGGPFEALQAKGTANTLGATLRYPLLLAANRQSLLEASIARRSAQDDTLAGNVANKRATYLALAHSYSAASEQTSQRLQTSLTLGHLDLSRNPGNQAQDAATAQTQGSYAKLRLDYALGYSLANSSQLQARLALQTTNRNLDSAEKLSLGGPNGVRGWPVGEANGDEGTVINLEWRNALPWLASSGIATTLTPFVDWGQIRQNKRLWANALPAGRANSYSLSGTGITLQLAKPGDWQLSLTLATPLGNNPGVDARGNNADGKKKKSRVWLSAQKVL